MMIWRWLLALALALISSSAWAVSPCPGVPYSFVNGVIAQAPQINANFTSLQNCVLGIITGANAPNGIAIFDSSGNIAVPGPVLYVGGIGGIFMQDSSGSGYIRDTSSLNLGYGSTNVVGISATGVTDSLGFTSQAEIDGANIGDVTYVTPKYCDWSTFGTDQTACIQAAVNAACAAGKGGNVGGRVVLARGGYYIKAASTGITTPRSCSAPYIVGMGAAGGGSGYNSPPALGISGTWIFTDFNCAGPIFAFNSDAIANYNYGGGIEAVSFYNAPLGGDTYGSSSCKKPLIQTKYTADFIVKDVYAWLPYTLVQLIGGNRDLIYNIYADQVLQDGTLIDLFGSGAHPDATGQATRQDAITLQDITAGGGPVAAFHQSAIGIYQHGFSATVRGNRLAFEGTGTALKIDCTVPGGYIVAAEQGACPAYDVFFDFEAECGGCNGVDAQDMQDLTLYSPYLHGFGPGGFGGGMGKGIYYRNGLFTQSSGLAVYGGQITNCNESCVLEEAAASIIEGINIYNSNLSNVGGTDIAITSPVAGHSKNTHQIIGNMFCTGNGGLSAAEVPAVFATGNDYIMYALNVQHGCSSSYVDSSGGAHNTFANNGAL